MTEQTTDQQTEAPEIERPSFDETYGSLTYNEELAVSAAFEGIDLDDLFERLYDTGAPEDGDDPSQADNKAESLSTGELLLIVVALEFVRHLREGKPVGEAAAAVKALSKLERTELLGAYLAGEMRRAGIDPSSDEGKGSSGE